MKKNKTQQEDDSLECVFEEAHIEKLSFWYTAVLAVAEAGLAAAAFAGGEVVAGAGAVGGAAAAAFMVAGSEAVAIAAAVAFAFTGVVAVVGALTVEKDVTDLRGVTQWGSCSKVFSYTGQERIYKIEATYENAALCHITPEASFVEEHFDVAQTGNTRITYMATAKAKSITEDKWALRHATNYLQDANCQIKMYAKKNELKSTHKIIADNKQKIENIAACLKVQDDLISLKIAYKNNQQELKNKKQLIRQQVSTVDMLDTWARDIFRPNSQDVKLLKSYLVDFASAADLPLAIIPTPTHADAVIKPQVQTPLPPDQLLLPANGYCLYTTVIMGYLFPIRQAADNLATRVTQLFGHVPTCYLNRLVQTLQNPTNYLMYLHSKEFGILVNTFMTRMQIPKGTWGGPQEIQTIANKLHVNIQVYCPDPSNPTHLIASDRTTPAQANATITIDIVQDRVHPAEVLTQAEKASAEDNPHYQHYRLKYTLPQ